MKPIILLSCILVNDGRAATEFKRTKTTFQSFTKRSFSQQCRKCINERQASTGVQTHQNNFSILFQSWTQSSMSKAHERPKPFWPLRTASSITQTLPSFVICLSLCVAIVGGGSMKGKSLLSCSSNWEPSDFVIWLAIVACACSSISVCSRKPAQLLSCQNGSILFAELQTPQFCSWCLDRTFVFH